MSHLYKRWIGFLALATLLVALLPAPALAARPGSSTKYTALGDSIAVGVGATNNYGYVYYFRDFLSRSGSVELRNKALSGIRSTDLLTQLTIDGSARLAVRTAQVVTISIGGNNLLRCASNNYTTLDTACAASGVAAFKSDWPKILSQIRGSIGSKAKLYVMTLYNPYKGNDPNYATADAYIGQINAEIQNSTYRSAYSYKDADIYADFQGQFGGGNWKICAWTHFCEATRDPHPTDGGHDEISRVHEVIYP